MAATTQCYIELAIGGTVVDRLTDPYTSHGEERALHGRNTFIMRYERTLQLGRLRFCWSLGVSLKHCDALLVRAPPSISS